MEANAAVHFPARGPTMRELTLVAGRWYRDGRRVNRELKLTPFGPRLAGSHPHRLTLTGHVVGTGEFITVEVGRHELPPEQTGPEREGAEPGIAYQCGDPVWVWSTLFHDWCVGTVDATSRIALQVTYEPTGQRGTVSDAVPPCYVARRNSVEERSADEPLC